MSSLTAVLDFQGDLEEGFKISVTIGPENSKPHTSDKGSLPANNRLVDCHIAWHDAYERFYNTSSLRAVKLTSASRNISRADLRQRCVESANQLVEELNRWLTHNTFWSIQQSLLATLSEQTPARIILCTDDERLWQLPWHEWSLFKSFPQATISFSQWKYSQLQEFKAQTPSKRVNVLACLTDDADIDTEPDRQYLSAALDATVLERCDRIHMGSHLWDKSWDVMVFSGHSHTEGNKGIVSIGSNDPEGDSLTLNELKRTLQQSVSQGLKLVVFNSCDGIGLARQLQELSVPHVVVMREPIPDVVAHRFLEYFFNAFKGGAPLDTAIEVARGQLEKLHYEFPCASWLPVVWQSPATQTLTWKALKGIEPGPRTVTESSSVWRGMRGLVLMFLVSLFVTSVVLGMRSTGILQNWELQAYDQLMRWRPAESVDEHVVVVGVADEDIQTLKEDPLSDKTVLQLLQAIEKHEPRVIGLDIYRDVPIGSQTEYDDLTRYLVNNQDNNIAVCKYGQEYVQGNSPPRGLSGNEVGFANLVVDSDKTIRRHLISTGGDSISECNTPLSLSFFITLKYLHREGISPSNTTYKDREYIQLGDSLIKALPLASATGGYEARTSTGYQIMANYRGARHIIPEISVSEILSGEIDPEIIRDKAIFVGYVHHASQDVHLTPYGFMPGVVIHAQLASQLINHVMDERPLIYPVSRRLDEMWIWLWAFGFIVGYSFFNSQSSRLLLTLSSIILVVGICGFLITLGHWITLVPCIIAIFLVLIFAVAVEGLIDRKSLLKRLVSP